MITVSTGRCLFCGQASSVTVEDDIAAKVQAFVSDPGAFGFVQIEFPRLSPGTRETMMTGSHEACFDAAFGEDE